MFNYTFLPPFASSTPRPIGFSVSEEGSTERIRNLNNSTACFSVVGNESYFLQTASVTMVTRLMTPALVAPFRNIVVQTDASASGRIAAAALPGWARARVETRLRVLDVSGNVLSEAGPSFFGASWIDIPVFWGLGFGFSGIAFTDTEIPGSVGVRPLVVELRISAWAVTYGWAQATADIFSACVTKIHVFSTF